MSERGARGTVLVQGIVPWAQINTTQHQTARALAALGWTALYLEPRRGLAPIRPLEPPRRDVKVVVERAPWVPGRAAARVPPSWRLPPAALRGFSRPLWLYRTSGGPRHVRWGRVLEELLRPQIVSLEIWDRLGPEEAEAIRATTSAPTVVWTVHPAMSPSYGACAVVPNAAGPVSPTSARPAAEPRIGHLGSVNPWFAPDLVAAAVEGLPGVVCELIGGPWGLSSAGMQAWRRLLGRPRVRWLGPLPYDEAMARAATWRAGLLPRNESPGAQESDPLKAMDYFACGIPCVTSHRGTHERFPEVTFYGATPAAFAEAAREALSAGPEVSAACRRHALAWTWHSRAERLLALVGQAPLP